MSKKDQRIELLIVWIVTLASVWLIGIVNHDRDPLLSGCIGAFGAGVLFQILTTKGGEEMARHEDKSLAKETRQRHDKIENAQSVANDHVAEEREHWRRQDQAGKIKNPETK